MKKPVPTRFTMVGAGRVASALTLALAARGTRTHLVLARSSDEAARVAAEAGAGAACALGEKPPVEDTLVIIAVSDDAIEGVARLLAETPTDWSGRTVLHTSGSQAASSLAALQAEGAHVGSFHPVQTFVSGLDAREASRLFEGIPISIEGHDEAVQAGEELARRLGASSIRIDADSRALFHAAAVAASNFLVTLQAMAVEMAKEATAGAAGKDLFGVLSQTSLKNAMEHGPDLALTGPIARGDRRALRAHLATLSKRTPHLLAVYCALATETIRVAERSGTLHPARAAGMLDDIEEHLDAGAAVQHR